MTLIKNRADRMTVRRQLALDRRLAMGDLSPHGGEEIARLEKRIYNVPTGIVKTKKDRTDRSKAKEQKAGG